MTHQAGLVEVTVRGGSAVIRLNSPANRNALSAEIRSGILAGIELAETTSGVRSILLTAGGPAFSAGMDLTETRRVGSVTPGLTELARILTRLTAGPLPVVARVAGPARAGGVGLLAAADLVIASEDADFALPEVRLGLVPAVILPVLRRRMAPAVLSELLLTGDTIDAERALAVGLVNRVAAASELDAEVDAALASLHRGGPAALAITRRLLHAGPDDSADRGDPYPALIAVSSQAFAAGEATEGIRARVEHRSPAWAQSN